MLLIKKSNFYEAEPGVSDFGKKVPQRANFLLHVLGVFAQDIAINNITNITNFPAYYINIRDFIDQRKAKTNQLI